MTLSYDHVKDYIESYEYKLISTEYINNSTKLDVECSFGHTSGIKFGDFRYDQRCRMCVSNERDTKKTTLKLSYSYVKKCIEDHGYSLLSDYYINSVSKLGVKCPNGHVYSVDYDHFSRGHRCTECSGNKKNIQ